MTKDGALNKDLDTPTPNDKRAIASAEAVKEQKEGIMKKLAAGEKMPEKKKEKKAAPAAAKGKAEAPAAETAKDAKAPDAKPAKSAEV